MTFKDRSAKINPSPLTLIQCCMEAILKHRQIRCGENWSFIVKKIYMKKGIGGSKVLEAFSQAAILHAIDQALDIREYLIDKKYLSEDYR